ncbi:MULTISPECIES: hypothetical protein [Terrabacteria group]|uniref:hypothetical protein n=1 Tax=Bacillati TaxID=1783272 RepID=UPI001C6EE849|nr:MULTISPECIES: hypothetical protein [Terrabacteria group]MBW9211833.1 hypothetical protein [Trueperella sp. zg.1013]
MKKYILAFGLVIIGIIVMMLTGCSHTKEDENKIMQFLNEVYGKESYTIQKDFKHKHHYLVKLKQYPKLEFTVTVSHQPFTSPYIWSDFNEVFSEHAIKKFKASKDLGTDKLEYLDPEFIYSTKVSSLKELKISYDKLVKFIDFISAKYPIIVDTGLLDIRLNVSGITLKGDVESETKYFDICKAKNRKLTIKSYEEIYNELASKIKTQSQSSKGLVFKASTGRAFSLGGDTFEDCLYKGLKPKDFDAKKLKKIILKPGEMSDIYTFESTDNYHDVNIKLQAKNLTSSPCSLYDAIIVKADITGSKTISIGSTSIELEFDKRREWIDPYKALKISPPKNSEERTKGVSYKNIRVRFEKYNYWEGVKKVTLTSEQ